MAMIRKPAIKAIQDGRALFFTSLLVRDFADDGFYRVDELDVRESKGIQRLLNESRARSFGNDIAAANEHDEAFLPTSVFLATGGKVEYDEAAKELFFDSTPGAGICPLDVVDGQHRIEGLKMAAKKNERLLDFPIVSVIAADMTEPERMLQFVTVNTKQRPVDQGVAQGIIARFTKMQGVENLPYIPGWLGRKMEKGDDEKALSIVLELSDRPQSPWQGRVHIANHAKARTHTIKQATFVNAIKGHLLVARHPLSDSGFDEEKRIAILINFWTAVEKIFVGADTAPESSTSSSVFKQISLEFFHGILAPVLRHLNRKKIYTVEAMEECIRSAEEHLPPSAAGIMSPEYWRRGGEAGQNNKVGMRRLAAVFRDALAQSNEGDIKL